MTQVERVLRHLEDYGSITSWEAFSEYGATRLSGIIFVLKQRGYKFQDNWITSTNRYGEKTSFKKYILLKKEK